MTHESFGAVLKSHAAASPDTIALSYGEDRLTWRELDLCSDSRAATLLARGIGHDDLAAIALPNGTAHHVWTFGAWKAGATPCILPYRLPATEFTGILDVARPRVIVGAATLPHGTATPIAGDAPLETAPATLGKHPPASYWKAVASGGSTGRPKIIVDHAPASLCPYIAQLIALIGMPEGGTILNPGPLYHNAPFLFSNLALVAGNRVVGMERFDAEQWLRLVERERVEWCCLVPTMMQRIWALPPAVRDAYDLSSLRRVIHMAAACPVWLKRAWIDWLGPERIVEAYAGTEATGTLITGAEWLLKPGSVGQVAPDTITIRNARGELCPPGEVGEVFLLAASAARFHYIGATPRLDAGGRMSLGDLGHVDADGYLFLADRRTDLIIRGGANIYPAEIEAALDEHPAVASSVVIGLPCEEFGHRVHAILEVRQDVPAIADVHAFIADRLAPYKRPESYEVVQMQLRDEAGKVRRTALRDERLEWLAAGKSFQHPPSYSA
ncbi:AMP-binding protein [Rhizorhabdus dicambivorans]|uniref:Acid--CoA ligase n=1 Tax=Rhizorhabdus dicambivorans TaxID=1850238 RepID=A0A2A4FYD3_9SPHN|nr:AMP-binding protein [Rhizorhabdus dicambivorans]ATE63608.1 acid--CoA ligase [Rhizorhabdus dicambivorans]PCE42735.1 acid--CoA ligase [Rhizorhabdus dicambivorans]